MLIFREIKDREVQLTEPALLRFHRYLFILSHTRSYTTLLGHILGSHPRICGYAEVKISYDTAVDLIKLNCEVLKAGNYRTDCEYVLDKILYDDLTLSDVVLRNPRVTPIFMIREPEPAIASLVRMRIRENEQGIFDWTDELADLKFFTERAAMTYIMRLATLQETCSRLEVLGNRGLFLTADDLMNRTEASLRFLERELALNEPLREDYTLFPRTGAAGYGDTSPNIRSGRIVRDRDDADAPEITIPADLLEQARESYERCLEFFGSSPALAGVDD